MEAFETAITATCPLAFTGSSGGLFIRAVTALVAAHCGNNNDYRWPRDNADEILSASENPSFDFIIAGAGTAGSLLASRLSNQFPSWSVLLVEAGDDPGLDTEIPAFLFRNQNTNIDWSYKTYPDGNSCLGFKNNSCIWNKGRTMGGSSSINAMLYIRGHPNDYNNWEKTGNPNWGYKDLSKHFEKLEESLKINDLKHQDNPWYTLIDKAWRELGFTRQDESINEARVGTKITKLLTKDGQRLNTAKMYINHSKNLYVMKNTVIQKVIIDSESKIATGVEISTRNGITMNIIANREVILSAGSIATPQILMLSGIGPKRHLIDKGIECLIDLPVGKNLQDHAMLPIFMKTNQHMPVSPENIYLFAIEYMLTRTGPFSGIGITDFMGFLNTKNETDYPDMQFHHTYFSEKDTFMLKPYLQGVGYTEEIIKVIEELNEKSDLLGIYPTLLHPKSEGEILLADSDPKSKPIIKSNYFVNYDDVTAIKNAIGFIRKLETTSAFKALKIELAPLKIAGCLPISFESDSYVECYIRNMATTIYHAVGTAKMGSKSDNTAVVDHELLLHGLQNLRVVDASVMPNIPSGNTMAPTLVIAKKAVDIIKNKYFYSSNDEL